MTWTRLWSGLIAGAPAVHHGRDLRVHPPDGSARIVGELTAPCAEALRTVLDTPPMTGSVSPALPGDATTTPCTGC